MSRLPWVFLMLWPFASCGGSTDLLAGSGGADAGPSFDVCAKPSECVVRPASCCGQCGAATASDMVAINVDQASAYSTSVCGDSYGCPACYTEQDARLVATCSGSKCQAVNLALGAITQCNVDSDCRVRTNVCCECGGPTDAAHLVAIGVSGDAALSALLCDPGQGCPECAPVYPPDAIAVCSAGHCAVAFKQ